MTDERVPEGHGREFSTLMSVKFPNSKFSNNLRNF